MSMDYFSCLELSRALLAIGGYAHTAHKLLRIPVPVTLNIRSKVQLSSSMNLLMRISTCIIIYV